MEERRRVHNCYSYTKIPLSRAHCTLLRTLFLKITVATCTSIVELYIETFYIKSETFFNYLNPDMKMFGKETNILYENFSMLRHKARHC